MTQITFFEKMISLDAEVEVSVVKTIIGFFLKLVAIVKI